jgi:hypothetical protein
MDKKISRFMHSTVENFNRAIEMDNAEITWAVIKNLQDVVSSYEIAAHKQINQQTKGNK